MLSHQRQFSSTGLLADDEHTPNTPDAPAQSTGNSSVQLPRCSLRQDTWGAPTAAVPKVRRRGEQRPPPIGTTIATGDSCTENIRSGHRISMYLSRLCSKQRPVRRDTSKLRPQCLALKRRRDRVTPQDSSVHTVVQSLHVQPNSITNPNADVDVRQLMRVVTNDKRRRPP